MKNETNTLVENYTEQVIKQVINSWALQNKAFSAFFNKYPDEKYMTEVAPGRNRAVYLLGHLIATNDATIPLFGLGDILFPELRDYYQKADKSFEIKHSIADLKSRWETLNTKLSEYFNALSPEQWMARHMNVSEEDFVKEPHRNKLNVLLSRTNHQSYHLGQLNLLNANE